MTSRHDLRAGWLALAAAHRRAGNAVAAAAALSRALSGHVWREVAEDATQELSRIAQAVGAPGWCALGRDGRIITEKSARYGITLSLDGEHLPVPSKITGTLPLAWRGARTLAVSLGDQPLLGSPISIQRLRRLEGYVTLRRGRVSGWAWYPADPEVDPEITITTGGGRPRTLRIFAHEEPEAKSPEDYLEPIFSNPFARPRTFSLPLSRLGGDLPGRIAVRDRDGHDLLGSPLAGKEVAEALIAATHPRRERPRPPERCGKTEPVPEVAPGVDVIIPVHDAAAESLACIRSVLTTLPTFARLIVVDDASSDPDLRRALTARAAQGRLTLLRNRRPRGFPASCNRGMRAARVTADVILLNSDTLVAAGWIEGLEAALASAPDVATATPFSNAATIMSYPDPKGGNPIPNAAEVAQLAHRAARLFCGTAVEIPIGVGFCLAIRNRCLREVGGFRERLFAQGYGEENDLCLRARALGWHHVAAPGVFVGHKGGASFGAAGLALRAGNAALLERLHPGYPALLAAHSAADPLFAFRRRLDASGFAAGSRASAVILITHARGGGVFRVIEQRARMLRARGVRPIVLFPETLAGEKAALVSDGVAKKFPNLRFAIPRELDALAELLSAEQPRGVECHHLLGHEHRLLEICARLKIPFDFIVHDYAAFCTGITLVDARGRYCGDTASAFCPRCGTESEIEEEISPAALLRRSRTELATARRIIAPSADAARRFRRRFPALHPIVVPHECDADLPPLPPRSFGSPRTIAVIGAIGISKGYDVLLGAARDCAERKLPLRFVLIGYSKNDAPLLATGRVFVTGPYREDEGETLIRKSDADFAFLPSIWPETWCFALSEAWRAGLGVAAFALGAQAERIRASGKGWLLAPSLPPSPLNDALLGLAPLSASTPYAQRLTPRQQRTDTKNHAKRPLQQRTGDVQPTERHGT